MQKANPAYAVTGSMRTGVASAVRGTVVNEVARSSRSASEGEGRGREVMIGHPLEQSAFAYS